MKHFIALIFGFLSLGMWAQTTINASEAQFVIDGTTSREELATLHTQLRTNGFTFTYNPLFAPDRSLHGIEFTITANEGSLVGTASHTKLNHQGSKILVHINKTTPLMEISYEGDR
jgi:hypothetical protein